MGKEIWSVPCWLFFHGFAARINKEFYDNNYLKIWISVYQNICLNLPCPMCRKHAVDYISKSKEQEINTKEKLIIYLFNFHNYVNLRINKPQYKIDDLEIYKRLKMKKCYYLLHSAFNLPYSSRSLFNGWQRKVGINNTTDFLRKIWNNLE
uniref:thiol oxidase n=1 Tax=viral metagenome TaxID=1070528 RepID=A0A6C0C210_9ZZZZ